MTSLVKRFGERPQSPTHESHEARYGTIWSVYRKYFLWKYKGAMTILNVLLMTVAELFGNAHLKWFAENGKKHHAVLGGAAWLIVLLFLVQTLKSQSMMWTCIMWEAMIVLGGAITAYLVFGEKFSHWVQWLGVLFALGAAVCINYECPSIVKPIDCS
jgi:multidrug transporter EmrE-like cation transporter